jgi:hypothetical protein
LFFFVKNKNLSVHSFFVEEDLSELFHLPLSEQAFTQYQQLSSIMDDTNLQNGNDIWGYIWGSNMFTSSKAYRQLIGTRYIHPAHGWLWKSQCQPKRRFFFWLLMKDKISTRELLRRKTMELESYNCVLCHSDVEESLMHLFFHCPFAICCWNTLGLAHLIQGSLFQTLTVFKDHLQRPFFMEIIVSMCWAIWTARNDAIFRGQQHSIGAAKLVFRKELALVNLRAKNKYQPQFYQWLDNLHNYHDFLCFFLCFISFMFNTLKLFFQNE